jgi:glycosidase
MDTQKEWIKRTNVYEVNIRQYTQEGTFNAFQLHLSRLKDMGVQTLWFMPITPIAQKNKKGQMGSPYACSDYTSVNPEFGTIDDFKNLVNKAHEIGFRVIIDWVANHTGWDHKWAMEHPEWYEKDETGNFKKASGMDDIIELDFNNREMRREMIRSMEYWVNECKIDGFRCDLAFWVELDFWQEAIPELNNIRPLFWLAESDSLDYPGYMNYFDASYTWTWMHRTEHYYKQDLPLWELTNILAKYQHAPGLKAWFTSNHDENTWNGSEYEKYGYLALSLAVFSCTWQGIPLLYSGQELPNLKRLEFFEKDPINWTEQPKLHEFYKTLLNLHSEHPALNTDVPVNRIKTSLDNQVLAYRRISGEREVFVLINFKGKEVHFTCQEEINTSYTDLFKSAEFKTDGRQFFLHPWGHLVLVR